MVLLHRAERKKEVGGVGGKECEKKRQGRYDKREEEKRRRGEKRDVKPSHLERESFQEDFTKHVREILNLIIVYPTTAASHIKTLRLRIHMIFFFILKEKKHGSYKGCNASSLNPLLGSDLNL